MDPLKNTLNLIAQPQTWTDVVRAVLIAEYGTDYSPIDDSVADEGNDGYLTSEKRLFARHCYIKPSGKTNVKTISKMTSDFTKALMLKKAGKIDIERWTFVCNYDVPHEVFMHLKKISKDTGIKADFMTSDNVANLLIKHPNVRERFTFLHQEDLKKDVRQVNDKLDKLILDSSDTAPTDDVPSIDNKPQVSTMMAARPTNLTKEQRLALNSDSDYIYAMSFVDKEPNEDDKAALKAIVYTSSNPMVRVQALSVIDNWFNPVLEDLEELLSLSLNGVASGIETDNPSAQAESLGIRLKYVSQKLSRLHIDVVGIDMYANQGFFQPDPILRNKLVEQIKTLDNERTQLMKDLLSMAAIANDALTFGDSHLKIADAAGNIGALLKRTGNQNDGDAQIKLAKLAYNEAQRYYNAAGLNDRALYAMSNLANLLRNIGESKTAIIISKKVISEAEKLGLRRLKETAEKIKKHTEAGDVPDYVNGETELK